VAQALHLLPGDNASASTSDLGTSSNPPATPAPVTPTLGSPAATDTPASDVIAQISSVPVNSSTTFTLSSNGDPGILVHLNNGQFVAFDAACTHAGCPVDYDPASQQLVCPCHGAAFDPAKDAAVLNGPAQTPLPSVKITVNKDAGTISLS
jgi:thiosulfate dehydrogenase [quinone] large subunit